MATKQLSKEDVGWEALLERICESNGFVKSPKRTGLLRFLFSHREEKLLAKDVARMHFKKDIADLSFDTAPTRVVLGEVREKLEEYSKSVPQEDWICSLPAANENEGFQLKFTRVVIPLSATQTFWEPHAKTVNDTVVISGSHLFFLNANRTKTLRYSDVNETDGTTEAIVGVLKKSHPDCDANGLQPSHSTYLATGDVLAFERLSRWFHRERGLLIERLTSRETTQTEVHRRTPILIGRPQTNPFIRTAMISREAAAHGYRIHSIPGTVEITNLRDNEREDLSDFPISANGVVGPIAGLGKVFGIVSRLKNPGGRGFITIIACDYYSMVIARIAETLTDDKLARELLERMRWPLGKPLPDEYELLFTTDLQPGEVSGEAYPKLVTWRAL